MNYRLIRLLTLIIAGFLSVGAYFLFFAPKSTSPESAENEPIAVVKMGKTYGQAKIGGHFDLVDQNNVRRTEADFKGKFMVVYFGYSFCPDICPAALYNITQALNDLTDKERSQFAPLFISVDPERDTVTNLKSYMQNFHPSILGLTGSPENIEAAKKAYRVYAQKAKPDGTSTEYLIDHSSIVYLMDRQGRFITSFNHQTEPDVIVKTLKSAL